MNYFHDMFDRYITDVIFKFTGNSFRTEIKRHSNKIKYILSRINKQDINFSFTRIYKRSFLF